ncbi:hypothetical protein NDR87_23855 [Nocardia sp. CDC159]|uniref:Anti-sigma-M factor RsmA n=1 Tax=Nocardia pulmonis TaxID=2951408 RepID=A0A9X2E9W4_9NOCA|nr:MULTISPECIES: hypothetical protein [Nocardia]MCM6776984.1 hypothetical protein [Nocardia pulmonis]MCM6789408.1 hypothetical protein [Nocardia sp. CDC159]
MAARSVPRPPFSTDLLADLHADNLAPELSAQLWPQVREDPQALSFLCDLDEVRGELRMLANDSRVYHPIPTHVSARLDRLLDDLSQGRAPEEHVATVHRLPVGPRPADPESGAPPTTRPMPVVEQPEPTEPTPLERRRSRRLRWITAAAAAVAILTSSLVAVDALRERDAPPTALPPSPTPTIGSDDDLPMGTILAAMGRKDVSGPLSVPGALGACVAAIVPKREVLGSMNINYRGQPAVLVLLTGPQPPKITVLVVGADCTPEHPNKLTLKDIGSS